MSISFLKLIEGAIQVPKVDFVDKIIDKNIDKIYDTKDTKDLIQLLNKLFKPIKLLDGIKVVFEKTNKGTESPKWKAVGLSGGESDINGTITIFTDPVIHSKISYKDKEWVKGVLIDSIKQILRHELIHQIQFGIILRRYQDNPEKIAKVFSKYKKEVVYKNTREYLSDPLEIMAFAKTAVDEFKESEFSKEDIINYVKDYTNAKAKDSLVFLEYIGWFSENRDNKILKKFLNNVIEYAY